MIFLPSFIRTKPLGGIRLQAVDDPKKTLYQSYYDQRGIISLSLFYKETFQIVDLSKIDC